MRQLFICSDRPFYDGNTTNNDAYGTGDYNKDPATGSLSYHGGDFAGLTQKLDYLSDLGVNTIWITPIVANEMKKGSLQIFRERFLMVTMVTGQVILRP